MKKISSAEVEELAIMYTTVTKRGSLLRRLAVFLAAAVSAVALTTVATTPANAADPQICSAPKADPGAHFTLEVCLVIGSTAVSGTTKLFFDKGITAQSSIAVTVCRDGVCVGPPPCPIKAQSGNGVQQCTGFVGRSPGQHTYQAFGIDNFTGVPVGPATATT